jgi:hypothetical protein
MAESIINMGKTKLLIAFVLALMLTPYVVQSQGAPVYRPWIDKGYFAMPLWFPYSLQYYMDAVHSAKTTACYPAVALCIYENPTLSFNSYNLRNQDRVCTGDVIDIDMVNISGEFINIGGNSDSPPIVFTANLAGIIAEIKKGVYKEDMLYQSGSAPFLYTVICSKNCTLKKSDGLEKISENRYRVIKTGELNIEIVCEPECIQFVDTPKGTVGGYPPSRLVNGIYGYCNGVNRKFAKWSNNSRLLDLIEGEKMTSDDIEMFPNRTKMAVVGRSFTLFSEKSHTGPEIGTIIHSPKTPRNGKLLFRVEVENSGDMTALFDKIEVNALFKILYFPKALDPGQKSEILLEVEPKGGVTKIYIFYSPETKGCLKNRDFRIELDLGVYGISGTCNIDTDCPAGETCCVGICRPSSKGVCDDIDGDGEPDTWVGV